jgi:hypothetical protein
MQHCCALCVISDYFRTWYFVVCAMTTWSKESVLECIEKFRSHASIWKVKSKEYQNSETKESAYSALTEKVKTVDP